MHTIAEVESVFSINSSFMSKCVLYDDGNVKGDEKAAVDCEF